MTRCAGGIWGCRVLRRQARRGSHSMHDVAVEAAKSSLYAEDELEWIAAQIAALQADRLDLLDREHLVEYLTDMTGREHRELTSRLVVLLMRLLKVREQPEKVSKSWVRTIREQQREIALMFKTTPSLRPQAEAFAADAYHYALSEAAGETGISESRFPRSSPWTVPEALAFRPPLPIPVKWKRRLSLPSSPRRGAIGLSEPLRPPRQSPSGTARIAPRTPAAPISPCGCCPVWTPQSTR